MSFSYYLNIFDRLWWLFRKEDALWCLSYRACISLTCISRHILSNAFQRFLTDWQALIVFVGGVGWWSCYLYATTPRTASPSSRLSTIPTTSKTWWRHRLRLWIFWRIFHRRALCTLVCALFSKPCATFLDAIMAFHVQWQAPEFVVQANSFLQHCTASIEKHSDYRERIIQLVWNCYKQQCECVSCRMCSPFDLSLILES